MGEATYYLKAYFNDEEKCKQAYPKIKKFITQGIDAYNYWQKYRGYEPEQRKEFWNNFKRKFPMVYKYLGDLADGDCNNDLAGNLDFGNDVEYDFENLRMYDNIITYYSCVWHFADWTRFAKCIENFGAYKVHWVSDEYLDPLDAI